MSSSGSFHSRSARRNHDDKRIASLVAKQIAKVIPQIVTAKTSTIEETFLLAAEINDKRVKAGYWDKASKNLHQATTAETAATPQSSKSSRRKRKNNNNGSKNCVDTTAAPLQSVPSQPQPQHRQVAALLKNVGEIFKKYTSGKLPLAFKSIPAKQHWEELLYLTEPEKWSPNAMYQATRILASNMSSKKVEQFYKFVLLPRIRQDIRKNKKLHFELYQALKKAVYKPAA
ncbi:bystin-like [Helianthus annuus]|uniref:bystin-like n=1 Tax=Helianthus annuus TaxID=4232 RepID=UPI000B8F2540|nr:bystin-like [Helianthus annuus]